VELTANLARRTLTGRTEQDLTLSSSADRVRNYTLTLVVCRRAATYYSHGHIDMATPLRRRG